jgi:hypothetical protein
VQRIFKERKAFGIYAREELFRMHRSSCRKSEIIEYEKGIRREPGSEKPGIMNKIIKGARHINREDCGGLNKCVRR